MTAPSHADLPPRSDPTPRRTGRALPRRYLATSLRWPLLIAFTTAFWAIVMLVADRRALPAPPDRGPLAPVDPLERVDWRQGVAVGFAQALALIPGTSRSGITITTGLFAGLDRATAARYSFLLAFDHGRGRSQERWIRARRPSAGRCRPLLVAIVASFSRLARVLFLGAT